MNSLPRRLAGVALAALLGGCAVGPDFAPPPDALTHAVLAPRQPAAGAALHAGEVPEQWWRLFGDPVLDQLQARVAAGNLDLQAAASRVAQSRARAGIAAAAAWPRLAIGGSVSREAVSEHGKFVAMGASTDPFDYWRVGFDASWELDLWGRARRLREGAGAAARASAYEREALRVALAAETAAAYFRLRGAQSALATALELRVAAVRHWTLLRSRRDHGAATLQEIAAARAQLDGLQARIAEFEQRRDALLNALALLVGAPPRALDAELAGAAPRPPAPPVLPVGLPSELARRRPDIRQAEARLHAATAAIGVAKADFYPRIDLIGRFGSEAFDSEDLGDWASRQFLLGPAIYLPIFEGGRLKARLALTEARQQEAAIAYRAAVLRAWHEIDDALDAWSAQQRRQRALQDAHAQQRQALRHVADAYRAGAADRLAVNRAEQALLGARLALDAGQTDAALAVVALYKALGGGWQPPAQADADRPAAPRLARGER
ncbi:efflux transporter outer membrane subunit [Bordetella petrii]|uniref:efflux transporter outer membrane subunit n=1 Tax=Bordetella petrii TaxID=94624 RepID=UPI00372E9053